jgi:hypothetical protein
MMTVMGATLAALMSMTTLPQVLAKDMAGSWMLTVPGRPGGCSLSLMTVPGKESLLVVRRSRCFGALKNPGFDRLGVARGVMRAFTPDEAILGAFLLHGDGYVLEEGGVRMRLVRLR